MKSLIGCAVALLIISCLVASVSGETHFAEIEGHGSIISKQLLREIEDFEHDRTAGDLSQKIEKWRSLRQALEKLRSSSRSKKSSKGVHVRKLQPLTASGTFANASDALKLLDLIYEGHSMHAFWKVRDYHGAEKEAAAVMGEPSKAIIYGEVQPSTFMQLLDHVGARPGQKYYDLGSGTGKTVFAAWLLGLDATGVELVRKRWKASCQAVITAKHLGFRRHAEGPGANFIHGSFLDVDFSDADIVFIDSVMFSQEMMLGLANIARRMKPGAKIVSSSGFPGAGFKLVDYVSGPTSWNTGTTWSIQEATGDTAEPTTTAVSAEISVGADAPTTALEATRSSGSLLRQEPPSGLPRQFPPLHEGPILGATVPASDDQDGTRTCALPDGTSTGIAAAMEGAAPGKKLLRLFGGK